MQKILEGKTVQDPMVKYASQIGWQILDSEQAETLRNGVTGLFLYPILEQQIERLNSGLQDHQEVVSIIRKLELIRNSNEGSAEFLQYLKGDKTYYDQSENRERNLSLIDYDNLENNQFHVVKEWRFSNGRYNNRADVVFLINGIPVAIAEPKNPQDQEGFDKGLTQVKRYSQETPELLTSTQVFNLNQSLDLFYGVTWCFRVNNIFKWKTSEQSFEEAVKTFFDLTRLLGFIRDFIVTSYNENDELIKMVLRQHQTRAVDKVVERATEKNKQTALIWHTQGSGKTLTMITAARKLLNATEFEKPTVLMLIDRNELEDQLMKNLDALGIRHTEIATSKRRLQELLSTDYRGLIVSMIHKFDTIPADINTRTNIFVLVDEAHRTTSGDFGNYLMAAIPNATFFGFTGTPIDKISYGKGTFKVFGKDDESGYLDKYSIAESIQDGTTVPLNYSLAPNEFRVPKELLEQEFFNLADQEAVTDQEQLDTILQRAVNTKNFLKSRERIDKIARYVADHYQSNVETLGYKAFLVGVDREACGLYKEALDRYLPSEYSQVVYTQAHNDDAFLKSFYIDEDKEKAIRKDFPKAESLPKVLIVTEKLLTGFDAPCLYVMYMDKPMRDHTLLQAIARVNRPYQDKQGIKKPYGLVIDFVGIFDNLKKALAFDSDVVQSVIHNLDELKAQFSELMTQQATNYTNLVSGSTIDDKEVEKIIEYFRDPEIRQTFSQFFKRVETLYEIISPDKFLYPYIESYTLLAQIANVVQAAFTNRIRVDHDFQRKTEALVRKYVGTFMPQNPLEVYEINAETLAKIKKSQKPAPVKVINLVKSIRKHQVSNDDQLHLITISERADSILQQFQNRQLTTKQALDELEKLLNEINESNQEMIEKGFDSETFFIYTLLCKEFGTYVINLDDTATAIKKCFDEYPHWRVNSEQRRNLKAGIYKLFFSEDGTVVRESALGIDKVTHFVEKLFDTLDHD